MLKYIQFCIFNIKDIFFFMTMNSIIDQNHNKVNKNLENIFDISHNPFFVKKISLLLLRKK